jgi:hypothetical protein
MFTVGREESSFILASPAHKYVGEGVGRMLLTQTPGGLYDLFFEEVGKAVDDEAGELPIEDQPDVQRIVAIGIQYGIEIPPPIAQCSRA